MDNCPLRAKMVVRKISFFFLRRWNDEPTSTIQQKTHTQSTQRNQASLNTFSTERIGSTVPTARLSSKDTVEARATMHEDGAGTSWAQTWARAVRNCAVSKLHLPPTSAARPTSRARPSRRHLGWRPQAWETIPPQGRHHCSVHCQLRSRLARQRTPEDPNTPCL